ncbi:MAG: hypothetical protein LBC61_06380 [Candidatus Peribacteria bacterium]|nr:hypothetical protein [Candidatus Peribacteria bacterium]
MYCQSSGSKKVADSNCSGTKPEASRTCTVSRKT